MTYDPSPFILPEQRLPGGLIWTEVTWHPTHGESHGTLAAYAVPTVEGHIRLLPGIVPVILTDLGLPPLSEQHADRLAALVDAQLRGAPRAEVVCPAGRVEVVLHPRRSR